MEMCLPADILSLLNIYEAYSIDGVISVVYIGIFSMASLVSVFILVGCNNACDADYPPLN